MNLIGIDIGIHDMVLCKVGVMVGNAQNGRAYDITAPSWEVVDLYPNKEKIGKCSDIIDRIYKQFSESKLILENNFSDVAIEMQNARSAYMWAASFAIQMFFLAKTRAKVHFITPSVKFSLFEDFHPNVMAKATIEGKKGASTKKRSLQMVKYLMNKSNLLDSITELEGVEAHLIEDYADALGIAMSVYWQATSGTKVGDKRSAYQKRPKRKRQCIDISI